VEVGYERFLGPEIFFNPEIFSNDFRDPLSQVVDETILKCPMDVRRKLYNNIVLSGGTTMFKDFDKRLQRDIKKLVTKRREDNIAKMRGLANAVTPAEINVNVVSHDRQRYAVWFGGSLISSDVSDALSIILCTTFVTHLFCGRYSQGYKSAATPHSKILNRDQEFQDIMQSSRRVRKGKVVDISNTWWLLDCN
jgi:hypothetical protein